MAEGDIEILGVATPPSLSQGFIAAQEKLIGELSEKHPQHAALLRASLDQAKAATGYQSPSPDQRSPAQALHDRQHGVDPTLKPESYTYPDINPAKYDLGPDLTVGDVLGGISEVAASLSLPKELAAAVAHDVLEHPETDAAEIAATLGKMGRDYSATIKNAQEALSKIPDNQIDAKDLPIFSLVQLATWGAHLRRHAATRPKS